MCWTCILQKRWCDAANICLEKISGIFWESPSFLPNAVRLCTWSHLLTVRRAHLFSEGRRLLLFVGIASPALHVVNSPVYGITLEHGTKDGSHKESTQRTERKYTMNNGRGVLNMRVYIVFLSLSVYHQNTFHPFVTPLQ